MAIKKKWSKANRSDIRTVPANVGTYELAYNKQTVYIGSGSIKDRLQAHRASNISFTHFRYKETNSRVRAVQLERKHLKRFRENKGRLPKYNSEMPAAPRS